MSQMSGPRYRMRRMRRRPAFAVALVLLVIAPGLAHADCLRRVVGAEGYATLVDGKEKAMHNALIRWSMEVKLVADSSYSNWNKAQGKSENCTAAKTWTCVVRGTPCN